MDVKHGLSEEHKLQVLKIKFRILFSKNTHNRLTDENLQLPKEEDPVNMFQFSKLPLIKVTILLHMLL
jgi:hypothetical protein